MAETCSAGPVSASNLTLSRMGSTCSEMLLIRCPESHSNTAKLTLDRSNKIAIHSEKMYMEKRNIIISKNQKDIIAERALELR